MTIPIYDPSILPCIVFPYKSTQDKTTKYLGKKASTGNVTSELNTKTGTNAEVIALDNFWKVDCNHGLDPFIVHMPIFGLSTDIDLLVIFKTGTNYTKNKDVWDSKASIKILGRIVYTIDNNGDFILSDEGQFVLDDDGNYVALTSRIKTNKEITYASN